jgi:hypothetical protein
MNTRILRTALRSVAGLVTVALVSAPLVISGPGSAATSDPKFRKTSAPNVHFPVKGSKYVKDLKNFSSRHRGTDIVAPCYTPVYATHPGTAQVVSNDTWFSKYAVRVVSGRNGLVTTVAYLPKVTVQHGQILQAGQQIGYVGTRVKGERCRTYFAVKNRGTVYNPSTWLNAYVGKKAPFSALFDHNGFNVASFNILGASHTKSSSRFATYPSRLNAAVTYMNARKLDVVGTQEFQETQYDYFIRRGYGSTWGACYWDPEGKKRDTENAIIYRKSRFEMLECNWFDIPYFNGNIRHVPAALLKEKATGRTAWFMNVHNPANVYGNAARYRARAIAIEKQKMIDLRGSGRPVFLTGDFNDRQAAFCPLTADKLSISPNSIPSTRCAYPRESSIDWIFAAGQTRFTTFLRDKYTQNKRISDHPAIIARAHLQD